MLNPSQEYFHAIIPSIIDIISSRQSPTYTRAAAFAISQMLSPDTTLHHKLTSSIILSFLHQPFCEVTEEHAGPAASSSLSKFTPATALSTLVTLVSNTDPSPILMMALLSPITPALYSLYHHVGGVKTSDPSLKESLRGLLVTWGKIVGQSEGLDVFWHIIMNNEGGWQVDLEGHIHKLAR